MPNVGELDSQEGHVVSRDIIVLIPAIITLRYVDVLSNSDRMINSMLPEVCTRNGAKVCHFLRLERSPNSDIILLQHHNHHQLGFYFLKLSVCSVNNDIQRPGVFQHSSLNVR